MRPATFSFAVLLICSTAAAAQDVTIISKVTRSDGSSATTTSYMSGDHARWSGGEGEVIIDAKAGTMTTLDNKKKTYYVTTRQDMDAAAAKMQEQMNSPEVKKAQEAMKNLPPEQRKQMEAAMGSMFTFDVQKVGTSRKIAGYNCDDWTVKMGQMSTTEECITNEVKFPLMAWDMYKSYMNVMQTMMSAMGPMGKNMAAMQEQFKKMKGFPLATKTTVSIMGRKSVHSSEVTEIKSGPIPASAWEVPAGYTKVDNPMTKALARSR
ncbi:MAG TPA: DUF4412 domain-containing protein [Thermoanaerobaculia bacterium]|nr:DUF4412 domain-containing protein [Thermoanaerobaculia bacterium]